ncbi:ADP-ribosylation factor-like protein 2-binding protein [Uranotaenia lowii]|uniref:ADP-ribosylation factor-like protein 2-binding protein n=1 Tax=Uranotaenia lowii TaxID=190385 RepID=UPI0024791C5F|nr:ADP-ribosylation factor-like protein 2-binding protein [Uranotaenia lowii]
MAFEDSPERRQITTPYFDTVIGHIEDIVIGEEFQSMVNQFLSCYYNFFDREDENKIIYTEIYQKYTSLIETFIVESLNERMLDSFDMDRFAQELETKKSQLDGEIFELLHTLTDFLAFKDMVLDYKACKEGIYDDLSKGLSVTSLQK